MISLGIDPGKSGAIAFIENGVVTSCYPLPYVGDELDILTVAREIITSVKRNPNIKAVLERVHAMPGQGVCSMFTFGQGYGEIRGMLKSLGIPIIEPTPQQWKKVVLAGMDWKGNKVISCEYVMKKHPSVNLRPGKKRNPHDGMADAICLAEYGGRT